MNTVSYHQKSEFGNMIGESPAMSSVKELITKVAPGDHTTLILGPSGTGKEMAARAVHDLSDRRTGPLVIVHCGALPENLLESELFGHCKGAFTGAHKEREGRIAQAQGGTLFLDEIGELSPLMQVKLLRVIQFKTFERVGEGRSIKADIRIVTATHRDLKQGVADGWFREDLYYRLNVVPITLPPLRDRREDIPLLVDHFFHQCSDNCTNGASAITPRALEALENHPFPGNVRELENIVRRATILGNGCRIQLADLPAELLQGVSETVSGETGGLVDIDSLTEALKKITVRDKNGRKVFWHRRLRCVRIEELTVFLASRGRERFSRKSFADFLEWRNKNNRNRYKTAGDYLRVLRQSGICVHNGKKANRSAYRLDANFLLNESPASTDDHRSLPAFAGSIFGMHRHG